MKRILLLLLMIILVACKPPQKIKYETRAVWMSRFEFAQHKNAQESQRYIRDAFKRFKKAGLNVVIYQVRGNGDAFYQSQYEPWSYML
ncbi:MAG: hypothetical protein GF313_07600, partial [Caldithrix sp.]|nr:hypothetical protein [Caldithrix sp.]